jgi:SAM-dependent methyltransferase
MARFDPDSYERYRVHYPPELFEPLRPLVGSGFSSGWSVADLGAGTGISSSSFLRFAPWVTALYWVDPDPSMLARGEIADEFSRVRLEKVCAPAESFDVPCRVDGVLIGSAWHWMNSSAVLDGLTQRLKPGGWLAIFEYQFPKAYGAGSAHGINEWVRRQFNQVWKPLGQTPRGSFDELLEPARTHRDFSFRAKNSVTRVWGLDVEAFEGVIVSQSRYLAHEARLPPEEKALARNALRAALQDFWGNQGGISFEYRFEIRIFQTRFV